MQAATKIWPVNRATVNWTTRKNIFPILPYEVAKKQTHPRKYNRYNYSYNLTMKHWGGESQGTFNTPHIITTYQYQPSPESFSDHCPPIGTSCNKQSADRRDFCTFSPLHLENSVYNEHTWFFWVLETGRNYDEVKSLDRGLAVIQPQCCHCQSVRSTLIRKEAK